MKSYQSREIGGRELQGSKDTKHHIEYILQIHTAWGL